MKHLKSFDVQKYLADQLKDPDFKKEWEKLEPGYQLEREMIKARIESKLSQEELAKKVNTTQAVISRIESMSVSPTINMVNRIAIAFGKKLEIRFVSTD